MIKEKYSYLGLKIGMKVLIFGVEFEGVPGVIKNINDYGNLVVEFDEPQIAEDQSGKFPYSRILVHPKQVEVVRE
jgi:hypothetical protein